MVILLSVIGIVFTAVSGFINMLITVYMGYLGLAVGAGVNLLFAVFMEKLREDMAEKTDAKKFFIMAETVPLILSGLIFALVMYLDSINYWGGFFGGMFETIWSFSSFAGSIMIMTFHMVILKIKNKKMRKG